MKYPKTYHLPWSQGLQNDDRMLPDLSCLENKELVYTEKLDGEGTLCSLNEIHARSEDGYGKPWQHYMKKLYSCFKHSIPEDMLIFGENVYAIHSIEYTLLPTCFFVFSIVYKDEWLAWDDVLEQSLALGLDVVPEIKRGPIENIPIPSKSCFGPVCEGYVVRNLKSYKLKDFEYNVSKCVRKGHVQTDVHWTKTWRPATFIEDPFTRIMQKSKTL